MNKKLLSIVLVIAMMLSMFSFAGAAIFPDVSGSTEAAVTRLAGLGILAGYPDGTFKPENNITRAEFAKIAILAMGLETTANMLVNVPTKFSDAPAGQWYTGYVNLAASLNVLKGYPDGKFKPNANISEAEAITIILRLLGYNDELPGEWPFDYIVRANQISLIAAGFNAGSPAKRGAVAGWVSAALDKGTVTWNKDSGFSTPDDAKKLIKNSFGGSVSALTTVSAVSLATGTDKYHTINGTLKVSKDVKVANGSFGASLVNHKVVYTTKDTTDGAVIVAIEVKTSTVTGKVEKKDGLKITLGTTVVEAVSAGVAALVTDQDVTNKAEKTAYIEDGKVYLFTSIAAPSTGILTGKRSVVVTDAVYGTTTHYYVTIGTEKQLATDVKITRNGVAATFNDLAVQDAVEYREAGGRVTAVSAWNVTVEGVVNSWTKKADGTYQSITINGVAYATATTFNSATVVPVGVKAKFSLDANNKITAMLSAEAAATAVVGTMAGTSIGSSVDGPVYFVTLTNGTSYDVTNAVGATTATVVATLQKNLVNASFAQLYAKDAAVKISYNAAGKVSKVEVFGPSAEVNQTTATAAVKDGTTFTHNGKAATALTAGASIYRVVWDGVTGKATSISSATYSIATKVVVTSKKTEVVGSTTTNFVNDIAFASGAVVVKDGAVSSYAAINLADEIIYTLEAGKIVYIEVFTPQTN